MIENLVDSAIAAMLGTIPGLTVSTGMADNYPNLATPYCVVYSDIESFEGRKPVYKFNTTIEYVSIPGQDLASGVEAMLDQIDTILLNTRLSTALWQGITKSMQETGSRRIDKREFTVFAQPSFS